MDLLDLSTISTESILHDAWVHNSYRDITFYRYLRELLQVRRLSSNDLAKVRIGKENDGGYVLLDDFKEGGIAYSFGISDDVSWDSDMVDRGYDVYMYDHTIPALPMEKERFHFFKQGLAGDNSAYPQLATLKKYLEENGHSSHQHMILKVDVEGAEWDWLQSVEEATLNQFDQIVIELHWCTNYSLREKILKGIQKINKTHGVLHLHGNNYARVFWLDGIPHPDVLEVLWVNRSVYSIDDSYRARPMEPLDQPNALERDEINLTGWESRDDLVAGSWEKTYGFVVSGSSWLKTVSVGNRDFREVGYCYLYLLYRLLDEQQPNAILEYNFGQATKMVAQYAATHEAMHVVLEHDRSRVEHFMSCWKVPWKKTTIYGSPLMSTKRNGQEGVVYKGGEEAYTDWQYNLILLKCPFVDGLRVHFDILPKLPGILCDDFAVLIDHIEEGSGEMIAGDIENIFLQNGIKYVRKNFLAASRSVCLLASESWKYTEEF